MIKNLLCGKPLIDFFEYQMIVELSGILEGLWNEKGANGEMPKTDS